MFYIGLMSGTSMDAVDAAIVDFEQDRLHLHTYRQYPIEPGLQARVRSVNQSTAVEVISGLDNVLGELFADAVDRVLEESGLDSGSIAAIGSHGQTVLHLPDAEQPRSLQIGNPAIIAQRCGITTVADFRRADMAAGGQGAPLAPGFHAFCFGATGQDRIVLNIGGMANVTVLGRDRITGFDTGPGNALLDDWAQLQQGVEYDRDGAWAASGRCNETLLAGMLACDYFTRPPPKSTGRDEFNLDWLSGRLHACSPEPVAADVQATLLQLTALTIAEAIRDVATDATEVLVCGGGVHNTELMKRLEQELQGMPVYSTGRLSVDPDAVEAMAFAWLARQRLQGKPGNIPAVTGAREAVVLGGVYEPQARDR